MSHTSYFNKKSKSWRFILSSVATVVAFGLIAYGGWGLWQYWHTTHDQPQTITQTVITHSTDTPNETNPTTACTNYKVADNHPKRIHIPALDVSGCITKVGVDQHGAIAAPDNIYTAGWYINSALPGQPGLSIIDGHLSGRYKKDAIFQHLNKLKKGETFTVTLGNDKVLKYQVFNVKTVSLDNAIDTLLAKDPNISSQLNLITCGGSYDKTTQQYNRRVIVSAKLLST